MTEQTKSPDERAVTLAELAAPEAAPWERPHTLPSSPLFPSCEQGPADIDSLLGVTAAAAAAAVVVVAAGD